MFGDIPGFVDDSEQKTLAHINRIWLAVWWRHDMGTLSTSVTFCDENPRITSGFPSWRAINAKPWFIICLSKMLKTFDLQMIWVAMTLMRCHSMGCLWPGKTDTIIWQRRCVNVECRKLQYSEHLARRRLDQHTGQSPASGWVYAIQNWRHMCP